MIETIGDEQTLSPFITSFEDRGFAHFQGVYTADQIEAFHDLHSDVVADWCYVNGSDITPDAVGGLLERFPRRILHAVSHPLLLGFAEAVMGPFVQLDSAVVNSDPPVGREKRLRPVMWHRDRFGSVPPDRYLRPASMVFLSYLQPMTDEVGPLRVIPRSHRESRLRPDEALREPSSDELLIRTEPPVTWSRFITTYFTPARRTPPTLIAVSLVSSTTCQTSDRKTTSPAPTARPCWHRPSGREDA